jgi:hypothetical protein
MRVMTWYEREIIKLIMLAIPAWWILVSVILSQTRNSKTYHCLLAIPLACWTGIILSGMYIFSIVNIGCNWSMPFMVFWPIWGVGVNILGFAVALTSTQYRFQLIAMHMLFTILTLISIVPPN